MKFGMHFVLSYCVIHSSMCCHLNLTDSKIHSSSIKKECQMRGAKSFVAKIVAFPLLPLLLMTQWQQTTKNEHKKYVNMASSNFECNWYPPKKCRQCHRCYEKFPYNLQWHANNRFPLQYNLLIDSTWNACALAMWAAISFFFCSNLL